MIAQRSWTIVAIFWANWPTTSSLIATMPGTSSTRRRSTRRPSAWLAKNSAVTSMTGMCSETAR